MRRFGGQSVSSLMDRLGLDEDTPIEHDMISRAIENAQVRVEGYNFDIRKHVLEYDNVVSQQREIIYNQRRQILTEPPMRPTIMGMVHEELQTIVTSLVGDLDRSNWDLPALAAEIGKIFPLPESEKPEMWRGMMFQQLLEHIGNLAEQAYDAKENALGAPMMRQLERLVMLRAVDNRWVRHLTDLDELREGIGLRAVAQQDPLVAYKREAHEMYQEFLSAIAGDVVRSVYHAQIVTRPPLPVHRMRTNREDGGAPAQSRSPKTPGRNDPCWCGSGKKYKHCHLRSDQGKVSAPETAAASPRAAGQQSIAKTGRHT
jgi:preprotein translocase subunit SecA